jgi:RNA polymerase sporulation-specific sigma factor
MPVNFDDEIAINKLVDAASSGDDEAMAHLISAIMPAAKAKASALNSDSLRISDEDLVQEGMFGFLEAVNRFDSSKGVPFKGYAAVCIENRIRSALRKYSNSGNAALSGAVSIDDREIENYGDDPVTITESDEAVSRINELTGTVLSDFERRVLNLKLSENSYSDIAGALGCSEKSVDNALTRIRKKLGNLI